MTDNENIKADELVSRLHKYCFLYQMKTGESCGFTDDDFEFLHDFINRQKAEIERLRSADSSHKDLIERMYIYQHKLVDSKNDKIARLKAENERLRSVCPCKEKVKNVTKCGVNHLDVCGEFISSVSEERLKALAEIFLKKIREAGIPLTHAKELGRALKQTFLEVMEVKGGDKL